MSPSKHKRAYRSVTDPLPKAIPIVPLHRDSITYPLPQGQRPAPRQLAGLNSDGSLGYKQPAEGNVKSTSIQLPPLREAAPSVEGTQEGHYSGWMTPYMINPCSDADNTCLGAWATCALYGKTHWRLQQIVAGKNPQDDAWKDGDGINSACWAQWGSSFFFVEPLGGALVAVQRSQIRGTYGIDGNLAEDMLLGICMPKCTQMQNDREVRAREGKTELRKAKGYIDFQKTSANRPINQQPRLKPQMKYTAGGTNRSQSRQSEGLMSKRNEVIPPSVRPNNSKEQIELQKLQSSGSFRVLRNDTRQENVTSAPRPKIGGRECDGANSISLVTMAQDQYMIQRTMSKGKRHIHERRSHVSNHLAGVPEERFSQMKGMNPAGAPIPRRNSRSRASLDRIVYPQPRHENRKSFLFALPACDTIVGTADGIVVRHSPHRSRKDLSYVHDFTDSPFNQGVLEYCEREEPGPQSQDMDMAIFKDIFRPRRPDQYGPGESSSAVSGTATPLCNIDDTISEYSNPCIPQHSSHHCATAVSSVRPSTPQHTLEECTTVTPIRPSTPPQHTLEDCGSVPPSSRETTPQHKLEKRTSLVSSPGSLLEHCLRICTATVSIEEPSVLRHTLEGCTPVLSTPGTTTPQEISSNCSHCVPSDSETSDHQPTPENDEVLLSTPLEHASDQDSNDEGSSLSDDDSANNDSDIDDGVTEPDASNNCHNRYASKNSGLPQHILEECGEDLVVREKSLPQHDLQGCDKIAAPEQESLPQHRLQDCDEDLVHRRDSLPQHTLSNCDEDLVSRQASLAQHSLEDCDGDLVPGRVSLAQHTLSECDVLASRKASLAQHTLSDCDVLASRRISLVQHSLGECDEDLVSRKVSLVQHTLSECDEKTDSSTDMLENVTCPGSASNPADTVVEVDVIALQTRTKGCNSENSDDGALSVCESSTTRQSERKVSDVHTCDDCSMRSESPSIESGEQTPTTRSPHSSRKGLDNHTTSDCPSDTSSESIINDKLTANEKSLPKSPSISSSSGRSSLQSSLDQSIEVVPAKERLFVSAPAVPQLTTNTEDVAPHLAYQVASKDVPSGSENVKKLGEQLGPKRSMSPNPSEASFTPSLAQSYLTRILTQNQSKKETRLRSGRFDGAGDEEEIWEGVEDVTVGKEVRVEDELFEDWFGDMSMGELLSEVGSPRGSVRA